MVFSIFFKSKCKHLLLNLDVGSLNTKSTVLLKGSIGSVKYLL